MRKLLILAAFVMALPAADALADNDIGCGLGTQIWEGSEGLAPKVLGATTNGTFGNQTFGITSGTLGCSPDGVVTASARLNMFASANLDRLAHDMAQGHGETLEAFAHLMNVEDTDKPAFFQFTKSHFAEIFDGADVTAGQVLASLNQLLAEDTELSIYAS